MLTERISQALALAVEAHDGQKRKGTETPYIAHRRRFLADIRKENTHYLRSGSKPLEPGDFVLPEKAWDPKTHLGSW